MFFFSLFCMLFAKNQERIKTKKHWFAMWLQSFTVCLQFVYICFTFFTIVYSCCLQLFPNSCADRGSHGSNSIGGCWFQPACRSGNRVPRGKNAKNASKIKQKRSFCPRSLENVMVFSCFFVFLKKRQGFSSKVLLFLRFWRKT